MTFNDFIVQLSNLPGPSVIVKTISLKSMINLHVTLIIIVSLHGSLVAHIKLGAIQAVTNGKFLQGYVRFN